MAEKWNVHSGDSALIKACLRHDRMAEESLYQKYFEDAYRTCNRYLSQEADIMSVVNEGFLKVFMNLIDYDPEKGTAGAWIHRIMVHTAIDHIRKNIHHAAIVQLPEDNIPALSVNNDILMEIDVCELLNMVKTLPEATRAVFNMYVMEGYSHKEIARQLHLSESTSRWHLTEAKKRLQQMIRKRDKTLAT